MNKDELNSLRGVLYLLANILCHNYKCIYYVLKYLMDDSGNFFSISNLMQICCRKNHLVPLKILEIGSSKYFVAMKHMIGDIMIRINGVPNGTISFPLP